MEIPVPEHEFLLWSWGGKNTAMVAVLLAGVITRARLVVVISLLMLLVMNARATKALRAAGYKVGLMGANARA